MLVREEKMLVEDTLEVEDGELIGSASLAASEVKLK